MRLLDLFSGIGGISLGLERAGMHTIAFCEINPFCRAVLAEHWPEVSAMGGIHDDITQLDGLAFRGAVDLIAGGFPCQDISTAGKGAGIDGARSGLWREMFRLVREVRPRWVLAENVPALRTRGADRVLGDLESEGYAYWPLVVGADDVGAPHRRKRVWIVAHAGHESRRVEHRNESRKELGRGAEAVDAGWAAESRARRMADPLGDSLRHGEQRMPGGRPGGVRDEGAPLARADGAVGLADAPEQHGRGHEREASKSWRGGSSLADSTRGGLGERGGARGARDGGDASSGDASMGHADRERRGLGGLADRQPRHESASGRDADGSSGAGLGDAERARLEGRASVRGNDGSERATAERASHLWPARPGQPQHGFEPPRVTTRVESGLGDVPHGLPWRVASRLRREALRALGNSVVPQVVEAIGRAIVAADALLSERAA